MSGSWSHSFFCPCTDVGDCLLSWLLPCVVAGQNAEAVGESCILCGWAATTPFSVCTRTAIRGKVRERRGIDGGVCTDLLAHLFCPCCALTQEAHEMKDAQEEDREMFIKPKKRRRKKQELE